MSSQLSSFKRSSSDYFEPDANLDAKAQRELRGHLEQIDTIAYLSNREVVDLTLGGIDAKMFQRIAVACANARADWTHLALTATEIGHLPSPAQIEALAQMRTTYEELAAAYDALRRMVERGYLAYHAAGPARS